MLIAYHNDREIKEKYLKRVKDHRLADELIKGKGWTGTKGCAVGCTLNKYEHSAYETELGIPIEIARLEDVIFEGLPNKEALLWPERFLNNVNVGSDLSMVWPKFTLWVLEDVIQYARPKGKVTINKIIDLFKQWVGGNKPSAEEFKQARAAAAAADAADAAAAAAADAAAAYAAAAADAAVAAAAYAAAAYAAAAADAAAYAVAAAAAARHKFWLKSSDKLIELIKECKELK